MPRAKKIDDLAIPAVPSGPVPGGSGEIPASLDVAAEADQLADNSTEPDPSLEFPNPERPAEINGAEKPITFDAENAPKKGRGRPKGSTNTKKADISFASGNPNAATLDSVFVSRALNSVFFGGSQLLLGDDAKATETERQELDRVLAEYLSLKGVRLSPGVAVLTAYLAFFSMKMQKPTAKEKVAGFMARMYVRAKAFFSKRKEKKE